MGRLFFSVSILFLLTGCNNDDLNPEDLNQDEKFYPLKAGAFWHYKEENTKYAVNGDITESTKEIRITITNSITQDDEKVYTLKVEEKNEENPEWQQTATWETYKNQNIAVLNSGSLPTVKLSFPIQNGRAWNGNALNALPENIYSYDSLSRSFAVADSTYENTITVIIDNVDDPINITSDNIEYEVYSENIGLIYHLDLQLNYKSCSNLYPECCDESNINTCFDQIVEGYILRRELVEYGIE